MAERKWTEGKWQAECVGVSDAGPNGNDVYEVTNGHKRIAEYLTEADAHLIAASKALYEALAEARDRMLGNSPAMKALRDKTDAVLSLARGESAS